MFSANDIKELREKTGAGMLDCKNALQENNGDISKAMDWLRERGIAKANKKESRIANQGLSEIFVEGNKALILEVNSETDFVAKNDEFKNFITMLGKEIIKNNPTNMEEALKIKVDGKDTIQETLVALIAKIGEKISFRRFEIVEKQDNESFGVYSHMGGKITVLTVVEGKEEIAKDLSMHVAAMNPICIDRESVPEDVINHEREMITKEVENEGKPEAIKQKMVEGRINKYYKEICLLEQPFVKEPDLTVLDFIKKNNAKINKMIRYEVGEGIEKKVEDFAAEVQKQMNG